MVGASCPTHNGHLSAIWFARSDERSARWGHTKGAGMRSPRLRGNDEGLKA